MTFWSAESLVNDTVSGEDEVCIAAEPDLWRWWMDGTGSVHVVVGIISAAVDWLAFNLDWNVLTVRIDAVEGITSIVPLTLDVPHEGCTIAKRVVITVTARGVLSHND